jgi:hypothetical protein
VTDKHEKSETDDYQAKEAQPVLTKTPVNKMAIRRSTTQKFTKGAELHRLNKPSRRSRVSQAEEASHEEYKGSHASI